MASESTTQRRGMGTLGFLGVCFVVLKLTGYITWSWWWVTIPFWGLPAFGLLVVLMLLVLGMIVAVFK